MAGAQQKPPAIDQIAAFKAQVRLLDLPRISIFIHQCANSDYSMSLAAETWEQISSMLDDLAEQHARVISELQTTPWSSSARPRMTNAFEAYRAWLDTTAEAADKTAVIAWKAIDAYDALKNIKCPNMVAANRMAAGYLKAENAALPQPELIEAIRKLDGEYDEWHNQSITVIVNYADQAIKLMETLPTLAPPPERPFIRVKRINSSPMKT